MSGKRKGNIYKAITALVLVIMAVAPWLVTSDYMVHIGTLILLWAFVSTAWAYMARFGLVSLGHGVFLGIGAYIPVLLFNYYGISPWLGMLAAAAVAGVMSLIIAVPTFRLRGHYFALGTIAFAEILRVLFLYFRGITEGPVGLSVPYGGESLLNFQFYGNQGYYLTALAMMLLTLYVGHRVKVGRLGYQLRALSNSHQAAEVVGVDTYQAKLKASLLSAALSGAWGTFYAQYLCFIDPDTVFGFWTFSVKVAMVVILGGLGTIWGPVLGALILIPLDEWTNAVFTGNLAALSRVIYGVMLIALILWQPGGLLPWLKKIVGRARSGREAGAAQEGSVIP